MIVVVVGAVWAVYTYFKPKKPSLTTSSTAQAPISVGDIKSGGDTLVGSGTIDKRTYIYYGMTDIELARQLGVAEAAVKNFLKILDQKHVPIDQWDHTLRQLAERYKELQQQAAQLKSEDPQVQSLQEQAEHAIDAADFEKAESLLDKAVELDNAAAGQLKANYVKRKRSAAGGQALKAKSLHTRYAMAGAIESYKLP